MFHDAATPTALCSLDTPQAFPRTATDKDAEGLTGCTMHWIMLTTARRRLTHQDAPCGARGAKGRQRRTDGIAAWRRHGGGASVSCLPTTPPCAGLGCELTSFEKCLPCRDGGLPTPVLRSTPARCASSAAPAQQPPRSLCGLRPLRPPHTPCTVPGHRARILYTRSSTLTTPVPLTVATTDTCSTPVPCPVVPLGLPHPTSCPSPPNVSYTRGFPPSLSWAFRPRFVEIVRGGRRNRAFQAGRAPFSEQRPVRPHPSVPMTP